MFWLDILSQFEHLRKNLANQAWDLTVLSKDAATLLWVLMGKPAFSLSSMEGRT
jgi:hypothetical protein